MSWLVRRALLIVLIVVAAGSTLGPLGGSSQSATAERAARHVDRAQLMQDVRTLSGPDFEGRGPGTAGGIKARKWIEQQFRDARLAPAGTSGFLQPFTIPERDAGSNGRPARPAIDAANVLGRLTGRNTAAKTILVTAHYDHLGRRNGLTYPGADDNASGVAALLAAARYFSRNPPTHPFLFASFDAEEIGLLGARAWLATQSNATEALALNVNLDMVSRSDRGEIFAAGTAHTPWLVPLLRDAETRSAVTLRLGHDRPPKSAGEPEDWTPLSDHGVFHGAGLPFVYFGVEDHPDHHQPTDVADRIDPGFFGNAVDFIVEAIRTLDRRLD